MPIQQTYKTGTITVASGSTAVTGVGTAWTMGLVNGGSLSFKGFSIPIAAIVSDTSLTLDYPAPAGMAGTGVYSIELGRAEAASAIVANRQLAEIVDIFRNRLSPFAATLLDDVDGPAALLTLGLDKIVPSGGNAGEVLVKTASGAVTSAWSKLGDGSFANPSIIYNRISRDLSLADPLYNADDTGGADAAGQFNDVVNEARARLNQSGRFGMDIDIPRGLFKFVAPVEIAQASDIVTPLRFRGKGAYLGKGASQIIFAPTTVQDGLRLISTQQFVFEDIEFVAANNNVRSMLFTGAQPDPVFSNIMTTFRRCGFRSYGGVIPSRYLIELTNAVLTKFQQCWIGGTNNSMLLGLLNEIYAAGGGVGSTEFEQCQIYVDTIIGNSQALSYKNTVFARKNATTPAIIKPLATGFFRNNQVSFDNVISMNVTSGVAVDFFTQGTAAQGLVVKNSRVEGCRKAFVIDGLGYVEFEGSNRLGPPSGVTGCVGVEIGATADMITGLGKLDVSQFLDAGFPGVVDNRGTDVYPVVAAARVAADATLIADGTYNTVATVSSKLNGGRYRLSWALAVLDGGGAANIIVRPTVNGAVIQGACTFDSFVAAKGRQLRGETIIKLAAAPTAVPIALTCSQTNGTTASTIRANGLSYSSYIRLEAV